MDKNINKLVSIILPTYNGVSRIRGAIYSILEQSYDNWELLVLDDGSTDDTPLIMNDFTKKDSRIKYLKNEINLGIQKTLNKGIQYANGEYIARIDDDDVWIDKDKLKEQVEFLEKNQEHVLVGMGVVVVDENNTELFRYLLPENNTEIKSKLLGKNCFVHSSVLFRKYAAMKFGGYDESLNTRHLEDYDLWLKLGTIGKLANLPIFGVRFMARRGSLSSVNKVEQFKKSLKLIKNYKKFYPNYYWSLFRSFARLIVYGFFIKIPFKFSLNRFIKIYKENW